MSAFGAAIAKGFAGLGGPGAAAAIVAGGILVGALGGGLAATQGSGGGQPASATGKLAVYTCPDTGAPIVMVRGGQKLLVTGRTEDSAWLRIHFPEPGRAEAWVQASPLQVDGAVATLPVAECMPELAIASPSLGPAMSLSAGQNNPPSAAPTAVPTPTPEVTPAPTPSPSATASAAPNARPTLASLTTSTNRISYDTGDYCPTAVKKVIFRVKAADSIGVASVALLWREPGAGSYARTAMTRVSGNAKSGTWQVTLDTTANGITKAGRLAFYAVATDVGGATRRIPTSTSSTISVAVCVNQGPTITAVSPASGTSLYWDPLSTGSTSCQTARNITATVKDSDGLKSVTLFYRRPGGNLQSKPMIGQAGGGRWLANIDTLGDGRDFNWIPGPPTDALRWYIKAVDKAGKETQLATRTLTVRRCDTEATFFVNSLTTTQLSYGCGSSSVRLRWGFSIADPDTLTSATVTYRITNNASGKTTTGTVSQSPGSQRFSIESKAIDGLTFNGSNSTTWTIATKDLYSGKSSAEGKGTVFISACIP